MLMGFLTGRITVLRRLFDPVIHLIKAVPGIGWLPIAIVWFGWARETPFFSCRWRLFFRSMSILLPGRQLFRRCIFRLGRCWGRRASGFSVTLFFQRLSLRPQWGFDWAGVAWAYLVLGEVTGVTKGLGAIMSDARMLGHVDMVLAAMIVIAVAAKVTDFLLVAVCRRIYPQGGRKNESGV